MNSYPQELETDFLAELQEDYVGIWSLVSQLKATGITDPDMRMQLVSKMLDRLLSARQIFAGQFLSQKFYIWNSKEALNLIMEEWRRLGRDPDIGEVAWFVSHEFQSRHFPLINPK